MSNVTIPWSNRLQAYNPSEDEQRPLRRGLAWDLLGASGLLDSPWANVVDPPVASDGEIARVHMEPYIRAVRRYSADPGLAMEWEAPQWGFVPGMDTVARAGMHEAAAGVCGAALEGARIVWRDPGTRAFCPAPAGLHHALANRASGFCIYNDCALAVRKLLELGAERVAYVDLDAHHGDGVQWIFYEDPRVLSISVHEHAPGFFPGSGALEERGAGAGAGATLNVPLPPFAGDEPFLAAIEEVVAPAVERFAPEALVVHLGADVHHSDPLAHLQVGLAALQRAYAEIVALATRAAGDRLLAIAGGGYNPMTLGRIWALQLSALAGTMVGDELPNAWREAARGALGEEPPENLRHDPAPSADPERRRAADRQALRTVAQAQEMLG
ncbi:MAG: acetoin utilization protein AcuC [Thermoleophilia bacterium]|nr:acetoin utilization protein AcuC [Thermoleophilia bacterium]MDH3725235.1 acetoin utilization protein AcuC [Thermoleophilia bacterium]